MNLYSHSSKSKGAKALADALGINRIKHKESKFKGHYDKTVINWGSTKLPDEVQKCAVINPNDRVFESTNKLTFLTKCKDGGVKTPKFTTHTKEAALWIRAGYAVVCRTILRGSSGKGIVIADKEEELVKAPLYTRYIKKKEEWRVHIHKGKVFDVQKKGRRREVEDPNWRVRNRAGGFVYMREDIDIPEDVTVQALAAFDVTGLDFGAVDVVTIKNGHAFVLEINTAPGLEGVTIERYKENFSEYL